MNRLVDVFWINLLWVVFSLPIITIGASTCAAYYVMLKMVDDEESYIGKQFVKAFKDNFKQGTGMWLITAPTVYLDFLLWQFIAKGDASVLVIIGAIVYSVIVLVINLYSYPLIARYENSLKNTIKNSMGISIQYLFSTIIITVLVAVEVVIILWNKWTMFVGILIGPAFIIFTISAFAKRCFIAIENIRPEQPSEAEIYDEIEEIDDDLENAADDETEIESDCEEEDISTELETETDSDISQE